MDYVFAADVDTAKTDKTSFPDFPGENPPQADMLKWLDAWHDDLVTSVLGSRTLRRIGFQGGGRVGRSVRPKDPRLTGSRLL